MTSRIQTNRFTTTGSRPPSTRPVGELAINFADNQISVTDPTPAARDMLPIRYHSATASYLTNDIVRQSTGLYQAKANIPAHAFNATEWNQFLTNTQGDARWLPLTGGTLTGPIESTSFIVADGDIYARGGHYFLGADDGAVLYSLSTTVALRFSLDGWALTWNRSDGTLSFNNNLALSLFNVDPFGNGNFAGAIHASNITLLEEQINHLQARVAALEGAAP